SCPELVESLKDQLRALEAMHAFLDSSQTDPPRPPADPYATRASTEPSGKVEMAYWPTIPGYEVIGELGRGGMGAVYLAVQKANRRRVALKVMLQGRYATQRQRLRFEREVDLAASLTHPNIVTIFDSGTTADGAHYCAMAFIDGRPLDEYLREENPSLEVRLR